jgi:SAM-dependent methyltransferase
MKSSDSAARSPVVPGEYLAMLCSPRTGQALRLVDRRLESSDGKEHYDISASGIPRFTAEFVSDAGRAQQSQYDGMISKYVENLGYPHTEEYMAYLDRQLFDVLPAGSLGTVAELCCGRGEAARLLDQRLSRCVGIDVSAGMLEIARHDLPGDRFFFAQADATMLPLRDRTVDNVVMLGGIHHVPDRVRLFLEVARILKPGGSFYFREPLDDFALWRAIRRVIYRVSSALDHNTERPLRRIETESALAQAGLALCDWQTRGFFGFCLLMNSDVLVFNRLFRYLPGIRWLTRAACRIDHLTTSLPGLRRAGLQVIGVARHASQAQVDMDPDRGDAHMRGGVTPDFDIEQPRHRVPV